jgi:hypothetical protein
MSQTYPNILATTKLSDSLIPIIERDDANKSQFSGTSFPTVDRVVGMPCYRLDQGKLYVLRALSPTIDWHPVLTQDDGDARYIQGEGGVITGSLVFGSTNRQMLDLFGTTHGVGTQTNGLYVRTNRRFMVYVGGTHSSTEGAAGTGGSILLEANDNGNVFRFKGNTVWHAGNQGPGSGLNADLLDGINSASFARTDVSLVSFTGDVQVTGTVTSGASDSRLKENFAPITGALDKLDQIGAFYFTFNAEAERLGVTRDTNKRQVGVVAQEVREVMPEAVAPAPADPEYLTVHYEKLVPLLIAAVRELRAEVEALRHTG